jgi:tetratricopeptide (TPR) repeat protein
MTTLFWVGKTLSEMASETGDPEASACAVMLMRAAAAAADNQHDLSSRAAIACELSPALLAQYRAGGGVSALQEAHRESGIAAQAAHPTSARFFVHRMIVAHELATATSDVQLLLEAAQIGRNGLAACRDDDLNRPILHGELCRALHAAYKLAADQGVLQESVVAARDAEATCPPEHPGRAGIFGLLCEVLTDQYEAQPNSTILTEAILAGRRAVEVCPPADPKHPECLSRLGRALFVRGTREDVDEAVSLAEQSAREMPAGRPERQGILTQLAAYLIRSFELGGGGDRMARAVDVTHEALQVSASGAAGRVDLLANLSAALRVRARRDDSTRFLEAAVQAGREAVIAAPDGGHAHATLGFALQDQYQREPSEAVLRAARDAFTAATEADDLLPAVRLSVYRALAWAYMVSEDPASALAACEQAVNLLPEVSSMLSWRRDRQHALAGAAGLASEAASAAVAAGRPERAVELLEQARGTLLTEAMDRRGVLASLADQDPELAELYDVLLRDVELFDTDPDRLTVLNAPGATVPDGRPRAGGRDLGFDFGAPSEDQWLQVFANMHAYRQWLKPHWETLLTRIRLVEGFESFMRPLSAEALCREASGGAIVMINVSRYRADALIVSRDRIQSVMLEGVDRETVVEQVDLLQMALTSVSSDSLRERRSGQRSISELLSWLWDHITGPVLETLAITGHPTGNTSNGDAIPRVWWCPIGEATMLPLHAAGHHAADDSQSGSPRTVLDRVVSSYTPTIRALRHARAQRARMLWHTGPAHRSHAEEAAQRHGRPGALIVAVPAAAGTKSAPLHGVLPEAHRVRELIPDSVLLHDSAADRRAVSEALAQHSIVHLACHGISDWNDPGSSTLLLYDYSKSPFTVTNVARNHLPGAALAYLSACDTTRSRIPRLHDEAIHITSAFQLAGFRHVIGTLWPVNDQAAQRISDAFYTDLTLDGTAPPRPERASQALHHAIRELRAECMASPSLWAAHIHVGM